MVKCADEQKDYWKEHPGKEITTTQTKEKRENAGETIKQTNSYFHARTKKELTLHNKPNWSVQQHQHEHSPTHFGTHSEPTPTATSTKD